MAFPLLAFLGGAAVGAVATLVLKDWMDRQTEGGVIGVVDLMDETRERVVDTAEVVVESVAETAREAAEAVTETVSEATKPPPA
jgi:gas vesicle protein